jgi:hypothetical protein
VRVSALTIPWLARYGYLRAAASMREIVTDLGR